MSSRRMLGIAGAAMIGTLVGTNAAHAVIDQNGMGRVVVAKETLEGTGGGRPPVSVTDTDGNTTMYYVVNSGTGGAGLRVEIPLGVDLLTGGSIDVVTTLGNMQLHGTRDLYNVLGADGNPITRVTSGTPGNTEVLIARLLKGEDGDNSARHRISLAATSTVNVSGSDGKLSLGLGRVSIDAVTPATITIERGPSNQPRGSASWVTTTISSAVSAAETFRVTSEAANPEANAEGGFVEFTSGSSTTTTASLGSIRVSATSSRLNATDLAAGAIDQNAANALAASAEVEVTGDISFIGATGDVYLANDCSAGSGTSLISRDGDDPPELQKATWTFGNSAADNTRHLCIKTDGTANIPGTEAYTAKLDFTGLANAAFPPSERTVTLGMIERGGTTVHLDHLTTNRKYNQRIVIQNRSSRPAPYTVSFQPAEGVTVTAGEAASGTLAANSRTVLLTRDVATIDSGGGGGTAQGGHTSATLSVVAGSNSIDVATVTTTKEDGSTDTVLYD